MTNHRNDSILDHVVNLYRNATPEVARQAMRNWMAVRALNDTDTISIPTIRIGLRRQSTGAVPVALRKWTKSEFIATGKDGCGVNPCKVEV